MLYFCNNTYKSHKEYFRANFIKVNWLINWLSHINLCLQTIVDDVEAHKQPVNSMIRTLDTFRSKNSHRLTPDQADTLERLSNELRERYDELLRKCRFELSDAELRLQKMRAEQEEIVSFCVMVFA